MTYQLNLSMNRIVLTPNTPSREGQDTIVATSMTTEPPYQQQWIGHADWQLLLPLG